MLALFIFNASQKKTSAFSAVCLKTGSHRTPGLQGSPVRNKKTIKIFEDKRKNLKNRTAFQPHSIFGTDISVIRRHDGGEKRVNIDFRFLKYLMA